MNAFTRLLTSLALVAFGLAGVAWMRPAWASDLGLDWHELAHWRDAHAAALERGAELDRKGEVVLRRIDAKQRVIAQLVAGETTLPEAAAWFRLLNESPADCQDDYRKHWPGASDGEKLCRQVIAWTEGRLRSRGSAGRAEAEARRLRAELEALLQEHGEVRLPETDG